MLVYDGMALTLFHFFFMETLINSIPFLTIEQWKKLTEYVI